MNPRFSGEQLRKYFVMGSQNCLNDPVLTLQAAIEGGITAFQFREKGEGSLTGEAKRNLGLILREECRKHGVLFFINDDSDLALDLDVDGIHIGQEDEAAARVRDRFPDKWIGLSVSTFEELEKSDVQTVDYLGLGPIFSTATKADAKQAVGTEWIKTVKRHHPQLPLVGIGGITTANAHEVIQAGADGVAVITAISHAKDIQMAVSEL
ncbi:thiamine phosphate synthase [Thalassobacillus sp. CUG 92003]|uniref:thiamine phosphate synthase n=1 Tax=Thalassobacillus sp. CUG 92003 TaxID=2736641 RepID=UPI0015E64658|nr:thiamine phosphate synthase [Thalassobacillus sp. CUG 92003]